MASKPGNETEIKLRIGADVAAARQSIEMAGFRDATGRLFEANTLWDTPDKSLKQSGELIRVREVDGQFVLTYKGPAQAGKHRSREELESELSGSAVVERILTRLGLVPVFRYEKYRTTFRKDGESGEIVLDETPVGNFLEIEGDGDWIDRVAAELGFGESAYVTASYADLYVEDCRRRGEPVSNMVFR